jgi:hypothetical protein
MMHPTDTTTDESGRAGLVADKEYCTDCDKPLGATDDRCFECGGSHDRGSRITNEHWLVLLGAT